MSTHIGHIHSRANGNQSARVKDCVLLDAGSVQGAQEIIAHIRSQHPFRKLILGHNDLGDLGCRILFQFLCSEAGQHYEINHIGLNSNHIGDSGLLAIAMFLKGNTNVKELFLQSNDFTGDPIVAKALADAVNTSHLAVLSLTSNQAMSDGFIKEFLPALTTSHLCELHLSAMNITAHSLPHIVDYISSKRCKLDVFKCNGNLLGLHSVRSIIRAAKQSNYTLTGLELHSNHVLESDEIGNRDIWKELIIPIQYIVRRNEQLSRETQQEALKLLRYARTFLLHSNQSGATFGQLSKHLITIAKTDKSSNLSFCDLPTEIQFHILSFLSPILSPAQFSRVCNYASTLSTLPLLLPRLVGSTSDWQEPAKEGTRMMYDGHCVELAQNLVHGVDGERARWLAAVGCTKYETNG
ncbi:hypothetical protein APHAL10511_006696 [Amanita phalloides]|nr:hypothetical protein APHAL10511_006696 [Amanita phalloides]